MKAILVIDISDENLWKTSNDIYERMKGYKCSLKPMPEKQDMMEFHRANGIYSQRKGWNACLEEILGETE